MNLKIITLTPLILFIYLSYNNYSKDINKVSAESVLTTYEALNESDESYYDLGDFHYKVSTESKKAQVWFDRGLALCHAFNHGEAVRCFERALKEDPSMPMAYWGIAYALGPNINRMKISPSQIAHADSCLHLAKLQSKDVSLLEQSLIETLALRYVTPPGIR